MRTPHPFRFGVTLLGAASRQQWIAKVKKAHGMRNERPCGEENLTSPLFLFSKRLTSGKMRGRRCCFHEAKQI